MMLATRPPRGGPPERSESGPRPPTRIGPRPRLSGVNLRRWWTDRLGGTEAPALSTWDELAARRWGPAVGDPTPGIIIDGPARGPRLAAADGPAAVQGEPGQ